MRTGSVIILLTVLAVTLTAQTAIPPAAGDGTEANPYQIATLENLYWLSVYQSSNLTESLYFIQTADIDASETINWFDGEGWEPIGEYCDFGIPLDNKGFLPANRNRTYTFMGHYDGQDHKIDGLHINRPDESAVGLFASACCGTIRNLGLTNLTVSGDEEVGGLVGQASDVLIENCFVEGDVSGHMYVGGLSGFNISMEVSKCYTRGSVSGHFTIGGIMGYICWSYTNNLYTHAEVSGFNGIGGVAGTAWETSFWYSYVTGAITATDQSSGAIIGGGNEVSYRYFCYNNIETTGFSYGWITEEMTYPYADDVYVNWDFENIWVEDIYMFHNDGYPYLSWQTFYFEFIPPASLSASPGDEIVTLNWHEPPDSLRTLLGYNVYRDDEQINEELLVVTEYLDTDVINDVTYRYHVTALYDEGESGPSNRVLATPSSSSSEPEILPFRTELLGNYPNPFNPETIIEYSLKEDVEELALKVYNIRGQLVRTLIPAAPHPAGKHQVVWDGKNDQGRPATSGVYFSRMITPELEEVRKMLLLK